MAHTNAETTTPGGYIFTLPDIGEGVAEGEILAWLAKPGEAIKEDQPLLEVMTDKVTVEIPAPRAGYLARQLVKVGDVVPVGSPLVEITSTQGEAVPSAETASSSPSPVNEAPALPALPPLSESVAQTPVASLPVPAIAVESSVTGRRVLAAPATRQKAKMLGLNLCQISGTGPHGRIMLEDVERASTSPRSAEVAKSRHASTAWNHSTFPSEQRMPYSGLRKRIGDRLTESTQQIPSFALVEDVSMGKAEGVRAELKPMAQEQGVRLTPLAFIAKATCMALAEFPGLNSSLSADGSQIIQHGGVHLGIAVDVPQGLIVPVIANAHALSVLELAREIQHLGQEAKQGNLTTLKLTGSTFTISSIGSIGGLFGIPIINPPEAAILGVNQMRKAPVVNEHDAIVVGQLMNLSLSADHRIVDGATTAHFMNRVKFLLQHPSHLLV
jgi:pyruvate dehydrogenase complex dihydrolipoamide acetyltransferase long form